MTTEQVSDPSGTETSLHDDLAAALRESMAAATADAEPADDTSEPATGESGGEEETADAHEAQDDEKTEREGQPDEKLLKSSVVDPPTHWSALDKERFLAAPDDVKEWLMGRYKSMEADYTRKTQETAEARKLAEQVHDILGPHRAQYAASGLTDAQMVRHLTDIYAGLRANPAQTIAQLAQMTGVNLGQQQPADEGSELAQLRQEVAGLKHTLAAQQNRALQSDTAALRRQVDEFANAKTESGAPKYPHFEIVKADMAMFLQAGKAQDLTQAYNMATRINDAAQQAIRDEEQAAKLRSERETRAKQAAQARKAASGVKSAGKSAAAVEPESNDLRETMRAVIGNRKIRI